MGFSHTIQMFSKENEKKVTVFLLFDRIEGKGVGFTLYLYMRAKGNFQRFLFGCFLDLKVRGSPFYLANDSVDGF